MLCQSPIREEEEERGGHREEEVVRKSAIVAAASGQLLEFPVHKAQFRGEKALRSCPKCLKIQIPTSLEK